MDWIAIVLAIGLFFIVLELEMINKNYSERLYWIKEQLEELNKNLKEKSSKSKK